MGTRVMSSTYTAPIVHADIKAFAAERFVRGRGVTKLCSHCQQPLPELRVGVRLSPLKAHIFDVVKRAGSNGITIEDINTICFDGRASAVNVRNHIHQINDALAGTDFEIRGGAPGMVGYFHIVKRHWSVVR